MLIIPCCYFSFFCAVMAATYLAAQVTVPSTITVVTSNNTILPPANKIVTNWQKAGMRSVGGIPNRTTVCATDR
jgi:hypothetical protein